MLKKLLIYCAITFIALIMQLMLSPWMSIIDVRPDFILIAVIIVAQMRGVISGQIYGFIIGLLVDSIGIGSFLGLSVLTKTCVGFFAGFMKNKKNKINIFSYYLIMLAIMFFHFFIFYVIYFRTSNMTIQFIGLRYIIPSTIYSFIIFFLLDYFFAIESEEL